VPPACPHWPPHGPEHSYRVSEMSFPTSSRRSWRFIGDFGSCSVDQATFSGIGYFSNDVHSSGHEDLGRSGVSSSTWAGHCGSVAHATSPQILRTPHPILTSGSSSLPEESDPLMRSSETIVIDPTGPNDDRPNPPICRPMIPPKPTMEEETHWQVAQAQSAVSQNPMLCGR
jgi:hypothetical protein